MLWFNNTKRIEFDVNDLNGVEKYEDNEVNHVSDKINDTIIEDDLLLMLYIKDDLLLMS